MDENVEKFVARTAASLADGTFNRLVLSNYKGDARGLQKISVRLIDTKQGRRMMFQSRFETRDSVKNFAVTDGIDEIRSLLNTGFRNAHLFTTEADLQLTIGKRNSRLAVGKPSTVLPPSKAHDREKRRFIDPNAFYLKALRIADDAGRIQPSQHDKWRQINKFVEILANLVDGSSIRDAKVLKVVDMGSGKGYLTFAAYDYLVNTRGLSVQMTGVEAREELVDLCNDIARAGGFEGLIFTRGQIADFPTGDIDILVALHACDTATDDALYKGIAAKAAVIVAAPCCHKEVRKQLRPPEALAGILKHGIMRERTAEMVTDGLRALMLDASGYKTKLFEFVPTEHTPKNNMLAAVWTGDRSDGPEAQQIEEIMTGFGIERQRLKDLLDRNG